MPAWPLVFAKGLLIGIANIIPGVSGGTFALLLGIYERLVDAIRAVNGTTLKRAAGLLTFRAEARGAFAAEWKRVDGTFLLVIGAGVLTAILACSRLMKFLLEAHPAPTLAFFVGLIVPSVAVPYSMMKRRRPLELLSCVLGGALVVVVSLAGTGGTGGSNPLLMLGCGVLAISAMVLPGISGSFLLLVLGQYANLLDAVNGMTSWLKGLVSGGGGQFPGRHLLVLAAFLVGAAVGLASFTRLLAWLLKRYRSQTMAFLIGLIVGSMWTLWPFKDYEAAGGIRGAANLWPASLDATFWWTLVALAAGLAAAIGVMLAGRAGKPAGGTQPPETGEA
ncbi:MAG: DUF368 domain-containing protein [Planctomycetota bacterium]